jgi:transposase
MNQNKVKRIIGLDMHPDVFAAAALSADPMQQAPEWVQDRLSTSQLEEWAKKQLRGEDVVVLEASGNSFEVAARLHAVGHTAVVLESAQSSKIRENFCNDDRHSAVKLAKVYRSGMAKVVWQPDVKTREYREVFFAHRNAVKDATRGRNRIHSFLNEHCVRLKTGVRLMEASGEATAKAAKKWTPLQLDLITEAFENLRHVEARRKKLERIMVRELIANPRWASLWRLMGIRHRVAFGLMALLGDVHRFPTAKHLVGYIGLAPGKEQSGNNKKGYDVGVGKCGRGDLRALMIQSGQNGLNQRGSPFHKWGWKLLIKKHRNEAAVAVARKITVSIWHLLKGHFTPLVEASEHLRVKLLKLATVVGKDGLKSLGFDNRDAFVEAQIKSIQISPLSP